MKAIRVEQIGGPEVLQLEDIAPIEEPGPGQAVVRVVAAGVNFMDVGQRRGTYPREVPFTPGVEGAGVVESVGEGVTNVKPSDRVAFTGIPGAYGEAVVADASRLIPLPDEFTFEQGAAFPLQGMTAHYLIHEFRKLKPGDFVLIHAAAGGMGGLLVQWAKHLGATVIGTTSTEEKARTAREAGAEHVIVYTDEDFVAETKRITKGHGADLIIDGVGKGTFKGDLEAVALRGHIVIFGAASGPADPISPNALMPRSITLSGGGLANFIRTREELMRRANDVIAGIRAGWLKLNIGAVLPIEQAIEAHQMLESRQTQGKLILMVEARQAAKRGAGRTGT
ncbi:MAG TPA: quinone oxidoreductase [Candidatus Acidoferrales bacterium]|nr:quinone oxidoreductase [Candidatus Acidoferrales bacterium]